MVIARLSTEDAATFFCIASAGAHEGLSFFIKYLHDVNCLVYLALASLLGAQLVTACNNISNTTGIVKKRSGRKIKQYMTVKGIRLYFSSKLPSDGRKLGDAGYLHARYMTESGDWVVLPAGTSQAPPEPRVV